MLFTILHVFALVALAYPFPFMLGGRYAYSFIESSMIAPRAEERWLSALKSAVELFDQRQTE